MEADQISVNIEKMKTYAREKSEKYKQLQSEAVTKKSDIVAELGKPNCDFKRVRLLADDLERLNTDLIPSAELQLKKHCTETKSTIEKHTKTHNSALELYKKIKLRK